MAEKNGAWLLKALDSPAKLEILVFFHQNRYAMDNAEGLSVWLGMEPAKLLAAADGLVRARLLTKVGEGNEAVFTYNDSDPYMNQAVEEFVRTHYLPLDKRSELLGAMTQGEAPRL